MAQTEYILGVDYGTHRTGLALAHAIARLPQPLTTLHTGADTIEQIRHIIDTERVGQVVVGIPRNMDGSMSEQSSLCEAFANALAVGLNVPVATFDETLSSVEAEAALARLGGNYKKEDIDAMAAALILERYLTEGEQHEI